tara:strand:- start:548 stop:1222 length:675 start_codon:yes stop_codon:yes gene_type:complete
MTYDTWEEKYAKGESLNRYPWDKVVSFVYQNYPRSQPKSEINILELGFGSACNLWFCAREGFNCSGVEWSESVVKHARNWLQTDGLEADLRQGSFYPLDFESNTFDIIIDRASLTCVTYEDCLKSFKEVARVMKKGGRFCFTPYSTQHTSCIEGCLQESGLISISSGTLIGVGDLKFYNEADIRSISQQAGLKIIEMRHIEESYGDSKRGQHAEWFVVLGKDNE